MLVTVSHEITSTLNLERVLQTIVNAPQAVIPYERAAVALEHSGKYKLSAVTGVTQVDADAPDVAPLNDLLRWAMLSEEVVHVRQHGDKIDAAREETRAKFQSYFATSGMRAFYAIPLTDDTGRVGVLGLESADPDFLLPAHIEILQVLAGQATVALRNAQMYKEVPFISVLQPVLEKKRKFMAMEKRRTDLDCRGRSRRPDLPGSGSLAAAGRRRCSRGSFALGTDSARSGGSGQQGVRSRRGPCHP